MDNWPSGTVPVAFKSLKKLGTCADYVTWAVDALTAGLDTPALRLLAGEEDGLNGSLWRVVPLFEQALFELRIALPGTEDLIQLYVKHIAQAVVAGEIQPLEAARTIEREVNSPFDHPADLMEWCHLSDGRHPESYAQLSSAELDAEILERAHKYL
jgi:hypothetical protein